MHCSAQDLNLCLEHGRVLRLENARGWLVRCEAGALMLSGPPPMGDVELLAGGQFRIPTGHLVLLEGWRHARVWVGREG